jgi:hypothetical protein
VDRTSVFRAFTQIRQARHSIAKTSLGVAVLGIQEDAAFIRAASTLQGVEGVLYAVVMVSAGTKSGKCHWHTQHQTDTLLGLLLLPGTIEGTGEVA